MKHLFFLMALLTSGFSFAERENAILDAQNQFGYKLFSDVLTETAEKTNNIFISPPSAFFALSMLLAGSATTTLDAMLRGLQLDPEQYASRVDELHAANLAYRQALVRQPADVLTLNLANALWADVNFPIRRSYANTLRHYYDARTTNMDFMSETSALVLDINTWAAKSTQNRITEVIDESTARRLNMLLANAIYFKGTWQVEFDPERTVTESGYFTMSDETLMNADVMHKDKVDYYEDLASGVQVARFPFKGETSSFYVILPPAGTNAKEWVAEHATDDHFWNGVDEKMWFQRVDVELPKFKFKVAKILNSSLQRLGMGEIFTNRADFSLLSDVHSSISFVKQDAFVQVDEKGAEAAVITTIGSRTTSFPPPSYPLFRVNRPFGIAIRDDQEGVFLFYGLIEKPVWE